MNAPSPGAQRARQNPGAQRARQNPGAQHARQNPGAQHARQITAGTGQHFLAAGFLLLALVVGLSMVFSARQRIDDASARATMQTAITLSDTLSTVRQAESGLRGYMLTGNPNSLATYHMALAALPRQLQALDATPDAAQNMPHLIDLHTQIATKLSQLGAALALYNAGQNTQAAALVNTDLDLQTMQNLRALITTMEARQLQRLATNDTLDARNGMLLQAATSITVLLTFFLGWIALRDHRLRTVNLLTAEARLKAANDALEIRIAERTASIAASETRFRTLAESLLGLVFMTNAQGRLTYVNNEFANFAGRLTPDLLARGFATVVHPEDQKKILAAWRESLKTHRAFEQEVRLRRRDGAWRWFLCRALPIQNAIQNGAAAVTAWIGNGTDIEDRKRAEQNLAAANAILEQRVSERSRELDRLFTLSTDILAVSAPDTTYLSLSPAWERITGFKVEDTVGTSFMDYVHPDDAAATLAAGRHLDAGNPVSGLEHRALRADGSWCWISWRAAPRDEDGLAYSIGRDVTEAKAREEQLRQSQKMEVIGQLTGGIAHDFNNLLTIIMGSLELLQRGLPNADPKTTRRIDAAMDGAARAAALTHRLLAFARRQPLEPQPIEPNRLIAGMSDMLSRILGEHINLKFVNAGGLWRVLVDVNQLENSILNLAVNARDAMPDGGQLTIETQNIDIHATHAAHPDIAPGQYVMIAVTDTGSGMTPEVRGKVFEPFFTTKPQGHGTGLGLAQVYGFIRQSNGHVAIDSTPGQGTAVKLFLPRLQGQAAAEILAPAPVAETSHGAGETILVVEDEEKIRNFSVEVLEQAGYHVLAAENAASAAQILTSTPAIDMLFTDVVLTGPMNGRALADQVQSRWPDIAVLFTTGYTRNAIIHQGRVDEGINFIGKPFTATALTQTVRKILDRTEKKKQEALF